MQTFLPYPDFAESARVLDRQRLGKQRVECLQILRTLCGVGQGWFNHPCTRMWSGHEAVLGRYGAAICDEWTRRGYKDNCAARMSELLLERMPGSLIRPKWLGNEAFHASHRSNLLRKDPEWYGQWGWKETADLPYVWPTILT